MSRREASSTGRVSWTHAVVAVLVAVIVWTLLSVVLTIAMADAALGGLIPIGIIAAVGCVLLLLPSPAAKGSGLGAIITSIPCAIGLALSLM